MNSISIQEFLTMAETCPVFDVRSESEYEHAHIPGAISLPIFSDAERAEIGTLYKQVSREAAIECGLKYFGPKMQAHVQTMQSQGYHRGSVILIHCWRGGMRSEAMAWLMNLYGYKALTLNGGYKAFRAHVLDIVEQDFPALIIGGYTGSGKTQLLHELSKLDQRILDLEAIAHHRGSSFGAIGCPQQTSQEHFENRLAMAYPTSLNDYIWLEDESRKIGRNILPAHVHSIIREKPVIFLDIPREARLEWLVQQYKHHDITLLKEAIERIAKRLGGLQTSKALQALNSGDIATCFEIALQYYDDAYRFGLSKRVPETVHRFALPEVNPELNARMILTFAETIKKGMHE